MTKLSTTVQEHVALAPNVPLPGGEHGPGLTASDVFAMLRRRLVLILFTGVLFCGLVIAGFATWWLYYPGYKSESLINCISSMPTTGVVRELERPQQEEHERFVLTQSMLLKSPSILGDALKLKAVRDTAWYQSLLEGEHLLELTEELDASPVRGTDLLSVSMETRKPGDAQVIVNAVVNQWYGVVRRRSAETFASEPLAAAHEEKKALEQSIQDKRTRLQRISEGFAPGERDTLDSLAVEQARQLAEQVRQHRKELALLEEYQKIYSDPLGLAVTPEDRALVEQDPIIASLAQTLFLLQQQRAAQGARFGPGHSAIKTLNAAITAAEDKLDAARVQRLNEVRAEKLERANTSVASTKQALMLASEDLAKAEAALQDQDRVRWEYTVLHDEIKFDETMLQDLSLRINELTRIVRQQTAIRVDIAQPATEPLEKNSPKFLILPIGLVFAIALAVGLGLTVELLDKSVRTTQDIVRHMNIAMLGAIPDVDDEEMRIDRVEMAVRDEPRSMIAEAFRHVRTNLQFSAPADRRRTLLISGPRAGDGKSTVACNLSIAFAQTGRRVLLVDANFRRPTLHVLFNKPAGPGLSNLLVGEGTLASHVVKTDDASLDLLRAGPVPPNPGELLGSDRARAFIEEASAKYDLVIFDSSPLLLTSDAVSLATAVDGVILVVRAKRDSRGIARRGYQLLTDVGAHVFGAVLNAAQVTRGGYFREQFRAYYNYQADVETVDAGKSLSAHGSQGKAPDDTAEG